MTDADEPTDPTPADATAEEIRALEVSVAETEAGDFPDGNQAIRE